VTRLYSVSEDFDLCVFIFSSCFFYKFQNLFYYEFSIFEEGDLADAADPVDPDPAGPDPADVEEGEAE